MKMSLNGFIDEELDMMCEGFFDGIEDLLDFPADDEAFGVVDSAAFPASKVEGCRVTTNSEKIKLRDGGISEDWISMFLDDSNFEIDMPGTPFITTSYDEYVDKDRALFRSFSPVSVLESNNLTSGDNGESSFSSSSPSANTASQTPVGPTSIPVPAKARTKRPRRPASTPNAAMLSECDDPFGESSPQAVQKKRKTSLAPPRADAEDARPSRKCFHCGIQKTPQWRAGPMGPRTLCNACGVRYRSGRLYPEYRPAASPTFVPAIHSNSHKKVVEMRNKAGEKNALKNCDLLEYIRRRD